MVRLKYIAVVPCVLFATSSLEANDCLEARSVCDDGCSSSAANLSGVAVPNLDVECLASCADEYEKCKNIREGMSKGAKEIKKADPKVDLRPRY